MLLSSLVINGETQPETQIIADARVQVIGRIIFICHTTLPS